MSASATTVPMPPAFDDDVLATEEVSQARLVWRRFRRHRLGLLGITVIGLIAVACILAPWIAPYTFDKPDTANMMGAPSASHWLGTDELGRDVLSRLLYAGRISLLVSLVATLLSIVIGVLVGSIAAVQLGSETVSSSRIRQCLAEGELDLANAMLLRPYEAEGVIISGRQIGRTIDFPTVNVAWEPELKPAYGVYAVEVIFKGEALPAVANYGIRPTVETGKVAPLLEAHILSGTAPTTGETVRIRFVRRLRTEQKFADLTALQAQIAKDSAAAKQILGLLE